MTMSIIASIAGWFNKARPAPEPNHVRVQMGVHFEEVAEMLAAYRSTSSYGEVVRLDAVHCMQTLAKHLKTSTTPIVIEDRKEFLDALCDQIVTATGSGAFLGMNMEGALSEVDQSNWSKFDENGNPIFDENGKISKSPAYRKPDLEPFV